MKNFSLVSLIHAAGYQPYQVQYRGAWGLVAADETFTWNPGKRHFFLGTGGNKITSPGTDNYILASNSEITAGSHNLIMQPDSKINSGSWNVIISELSTIAAGVGNNNTILGGNSNTMSGAGIYNGYILGQGNLMSVNGSAWCLLAGIDSEISGTVKNHGGVALGVKAKVTGPGALAFGFDTGVSTSSYSYGSGPKVHAGGRHAINMSANSAAQVADDGAIGDYSVILGGYDHHIPATSPRSVILGGSTIKVPANTPDTVFVPNLNIATAPVALETASTAAMLIARNDQGFMRKATLGAQLKIVNGEVTLATPYTENRHQNPTTASATVDGHDTGITLARAPKGLIIVAVNGVIKTVGNGVSAGVSFYFTNPTSGAVKSFADLAAGDKLMYNYSVTGANIATTDKVDIYYV